VPLRLGEDHGSPVLEVRDLRAFGEHVFSGKRLRLSASPPKSAAALEFRSASWPLLSTPLSLTIGKGGVGKTTISAGLAFHHRRKRPAAAVTICSTDPAPSLDDVFKTDVSASPAPVLGDR
jgi:arsenite-transporting ATPase